MPWGLKRYQHAHCLHFITFSCYQHAPLLASPEARRVFEQTLERVRQWYRIYIAGYVVMPEHVHLLISEPECDKFSVVIQMLKQNVVQQLKERPRPVSPKNGETRTGHPSPFWYARYYDFNVWSEAKRVEKLRYIHRNPVKRGLVEKPEDWEWSSFRRYIFGVAGVVEIESQWTARIREQSGTAVSLRTIHEAAPSSSLRFVERQRGDFDLEQ
jgi:putative transposase